MTHPGEGIPKRFDDEILPALCDFIRIDNVSPAFDPEKRTVEETWRAVRMARDWIEGVAPEGAKIEILDKVQHAPVLIVDIPGDVDRTALCYGHIDKQPPAEGWSEGLAPYEPVVRNDRLYGRGAVDDGYAVFAYAAIAAELARLGVSRPRMLLVLETSEESHSAHLPDYFPEIFERLGDPDLIICLDSACGDYERLWYTTALRGAVIGTLETRILKDAVHSGSGGGVVPTAFGAAVSLLSRIGDPMTGEVKIREFHDEIPQSAYDEAEASEAVLGDTLIAGLQPLEGVATPARSTSEAIIKGVWSPSLTVTGFEGLPPPAVAGNAIHPSARLKLSVRTAPGADAGAAADALERQLMNDPPAGAEVRFNRHAASDGWRLGVLPDWLAASLSSASERYFGAPAIGYGIGGGIPFINMLAERFPETPLLVTGLVGPKANAHGPDEMLHLDTARKLLAAITDVLADLGDAE